MMRKLRILLLQIGVSFAGMQGLGCGEVSQGELLVEVQRERDDCVLSFVAVDPRNSLIRGDGLSLVSEKESSFLLAASKIGLGIDHINVSALCKDSNDTIVEMGQTHIAVPFTSQSARFSTKRLPVLPNSHWYRMLSNNDEARLSSIKQNAIWVDKSDRAVIFGDEGNLATWNGYGWTHTSHQALNCLDFMNVSTTPNTSTGFLVGRIRLDDMNASICNPTAGYLFDLLKGQVSSTKFRFSAGNRRSSWSAVSSAENGQKNVTTLYAVGQFGSSVYEVYRFGSGVESMPLHLSKITYSPASTRLSGLAITQATLDADSANQGYAVLANVNSAQYLIRQTAPGPTAGEYSVDLTLRPLARNFSELTNADTKYSSIVGFASVKDEGYWLAGRKLSNTQNPPVAVASTITLNSELTINQANYLAITEDEKRSQSFDSLDCANIFTPESLSGQGSTAYITCKRGNKAWVLECIHSSGSPAVCSSELVNDWGEELVGIHGAKLAGGKLRLWTIGANGSVWLYQK